MGKLRDLGKKYAARSTKSQYDKLCKLLARSRWVDCTDVLCDCLSGFNKVDSEVLLEFLGDEVCINSLVLSYSDAEHLTRRLESFLVEVEDWRP
jgi:hypothetical protein